MDLVLSLFPGIGLLDRAFSQVGFCVVAGPDPILGNDLSIKNFHVPAGHFAGIIAGPPCQAFSVARRGKVNPLEIAAAESLLEHTARVILEAQPLWWLIENVPAVPNIKIAGYTHQRLDLRHDECGGEQRRRRHFQFGVNILSGVSDLQFDDWNGITSKLIIDRQIPHPSRQFTPTPTGRKSLNLKWQAILSAFDLPQNFKLNNFSKEGAYKAIRNGVPLFMGITLATAIKTLFERKQPRTRICVCGCGRPLRSLRQEAATAACRKRQQRLREGTNQKTLHFPKNAL